MSNCITLHSKAQFPLACFDWASFASAASKYADCKDPGFSSHPKIDPYDPDQYVWYWFLDPTFGRVTFKMNVRSQTVDFFFGEGRSSHTWRDFRHTLAYLNRFVTAPFTFVVRLSDEYDGHKKRDNVRFKMPYTMED